MNTVNLPDSAILNNLYVPGITRPDTLFEKRYISCRSLENRVYTDMELARLPACPASHIHYKEWGLRKTSFEKLYNYLAGKKQPLQILEIGCGNGWLSNRLSFLSRSRVTGIDINFTELQQAARVFNTNRKLSFVLGDIRSGILDGNRYDIIVFSASIQYFKHIDEILECSLRHLTDDGEIHIMDTMFYKISETKNAGARTKEYYRLLGVPEMAEHYYHHSIQSLTGFNSTILYNPASFLHKIRRVQLPFPWIRIIKDNK